MQKKSAGLANLAYWKGLIKVDVEAVFEHSDVDVKNIPGFKRPAVWNTMAYDLIGRGAN